jgi:hypothetical protein
VFTMHNQQYGRHLALGPTTTTSGMLGATAT